MTIKRKKIINIFVFSQRVIFFSFFSTWNKIYLLKNIVIFQKFTFFIRQMKYMWTCHSVSVNSISHYCLPLSGSSTRPAQQWQLLFETASRSNLSCRWLYIFDSRVVSNNLVAREITQSPPKCSLQLQLQPKLDQ